MDFALSPEQQALFDLTAARQVLRHAAWPFDKDAPEATVSCAMAQRHVSGSASSIADGGLQPHGGRGGPADCGIEKSVRDLRVHQILEGTNEIMRRIIARAMVGRCAMC
ncbi:MAG: hypothetical protein GW886_06385 [Rhodobacterales bacterium]|nr:hypothetical protein [Rhodobacterales bacterium]